jgi:hypothetical protein
LETDGKAVAFLFHPDGERVITATLGAIEIFNIVTGATSVTETVTGAKVPLLAPIESFIQRDTVTLGISPNGHYLAVGTHGRASVWDVAPVPPPTPAPTGPLPVGDTATTEGIRAFMDRYRQPMIIGSIAILVIAAGVCAFKLRKDALVQVQKAKRMSRAVRQSVAYNVTRKGKDQELKPFGEKIVKPTEMNQQDLDHVPKNKATGFLDSPKAEKENYTGTSLSPAESLREVPDGWTEMKSLSRPGSRYYKHVVTGSTTWKFPETHTGPNGVEAIPPPPPGSVVGGTPPGSPRRD